MDMSKTLSDLPMDLHHLILSHDEEKIELKKENEKLKTRVKMLQCLLDEARQDSDSDEDTDEEDEDSDEDEYCFSDKHNEEFECNDKKFKVSAYAYVLIKQWQLDGENLHLIEEITGTGKGGVIISKDLKEIIVAVKRAWMEEVTDDEDDDEN
jgi:hypothetical protein